MEKGKSERLLAMQNELLRGKSINKAKSMEEFGTSEKSFERDITTLRNFFAEQNPPMELVYSRKSNSYALGKTKSAFLTCGEMLTVCKILLESRSLSKPEMNLILDKLFAAVGENAASSIDKIISNERFHYIEPSHGKMMTDRIWLLGQAINSRSVICADYVNWTGEIKRRRLEPVGLMFSEYYFYLAAFIEDIDKGEHFDNPQDIYPTIYRVDRFDKIEVLDEHFRIPYKDRFEEGEFRKRVQFMYGGTLQTVKFRYTGPSVEAVRDRFPTAKIESDKDGWIVTAEVFGDGIKMWLLSQGNWVRVIAPEKFAQEMKKEIEKIYNQHTKNLEE